MPPSSYKPTLINLNLLFLSILSFSLVMAFSSHYNLPNDFRIDFSNPVVGGSAMWYEEFSSPNFQQEEGFVPNMLMSVPECNQYNQMLECHGLVSNFWPPISDSFNETNEKASKGLEEATIKVGKCSVEERKDKIIKYLKKRNQRNFNKTIKYACRKTLADKRVRVRGRFAKNNEPCEYAVEEEVPSKNYYQIPHREETTQSFNGSHFQMKKDYEEVEEDWLEEAMVTLMYSPAAAAALFIHGYDDHSIHS